MAKELNNTDRAAVLLMSLSYDEASKVLKHLGAKEVQKLGAAMASLDHVDKNIINRIYSDFISEVDKQTSVAINKEERIKKLLVGALGQSKANNIIDKIIVEKNCSSLETLKWMGVNSIAEVIAKEHPQIQAIVLSYLEPEQAAQVLMCFNDEVRLDLVERISKQEAIQPAAIEELNQIIEKNISSGVTNPPKQLGGIQCVASILKHVESSAETALIQALHQKDNVLATNIEELMFVFDNLKEIDDRGIQVLIREVKSDIMVVALKAADNELKEKIFKNMSKRSAELMKDDMEAKGPVRVTEVEEAQKEVITTAKRLAEEGKIMIGAAKEAML